MLPFTLNHCYPLPPRTNYRIGCIGAGFIMRDVHLVAYQRAACWRSTWRGRWVNEPAGVSCPRHPAHVRACHQPQGTERMKCVICKLGETQPGSVTVTLERGATTLVFKSVLAQVCTNCGEAYVDEATTTHLLEAADAAVRAGVQVEVRTVI